MMIEIRVWNLGLRLGYQTSDLGLALGTAIGALDQGLGLENGIQHWGLGFVLGLGPPPTAQTQPRWTLAGKDVSMFSANRIPNLTYWVSHVITEPYGAGCESLTGEAGVKHLKFAIQMNIEQSNEVVEHGAVMDTTPLDYNGVLILSKAKCD